MNKGYTIEIPEIKITPTAEERLEYMDSGDLFIKKNNITKRIEVKHSSRNFLKKEDWIFKWFTVCAKHSFDMAKIKPSAYIILSCDYKGMAIVLTSTYNKWFPKYLPDKRYGDDYFQWFYMCDLNNVIFKEIK